MDQSTAATLAAYHRHLTDAFPDQPDLVAAIVLSAADRLHAAATAPVQPATPPGVDDEWTPAEYTAARAASRARRAAELAEVGS